MSAGPLEPANGLSTAQATEQPHGLPAQGHPGFLRRLSLPQTVIAAGLVSFFTDISSEMTVPVLPLFLTASLGAPVAAVGLIEGVAESTASVLRVGAGWLSDRTGKRKALILLGYALSNGTKPLLALAGGWPQVLAIRFADRFGKGIRGAPRDALIADSVSPTARGKAFGFHRSMDTAGAAIGPLAAAAVLALSGGDARAVFWIAAVPGMVALLIGWRMIHEPPVVPRDPSALRLGWRDLGRPFILFTGAATVFALGNSSDAFLILRARDLGMAAPAIPIAYFAFNALYAVLAGPLGALSDSWGRRPLLVAGYAIFALVYAGFALAGDALAAAGLFVVYSLYYALTEGIARALVTDVVPPGLRATALGTYSSAVGFALLPASLIAGLIWQALGPEAAFAVDAGLAALAAALLLLLPIPSQRRSPA